MLLKLFTLLLGLLSIGCLLVLLVLSSLVCGCFPLVGDVADILYVDMEFVDFVFLMSSFLGFFLFCSLFIIVDVLLFRFIC